VQQKIAPVAQYCVGILEQSTAARNRVGIGLSYRPARLHGWRNRFLEIDFWAPLKIMPLYLIPYLKHLVADPQLLSNLNIFFLSHISGLTLNTVCEPRERSNTQLLN
jgi:hypothetical protein